MTSFFGELRRRNVVRVAVAYAIVGWVLIEVSSVIAPAMNLPDWATSLVVFFVILGFPLALILSWAYEITPDGMKRSHEVETTESITHATGRKLDFAIIGALVLALGFVVYNYVLQDGADESPEVTVVEPEQAVLPNSVAVIPFENMSVDPEEAFYAAGIHEEILNQLVKLSALNVIARTSMQQYANTEKSIPEIARELNVETVMEGSVRYDAGRIRITTQLNDGVTGAHLWSETYTRDFDDIFAIESDVAMNVANALEAEFSLEEQASIEKIPTVSPAAYALYLRGVIRQQSFASALQFLDRALELDPEFALAHATKALRLANRGTDPLPDWEARSREAAERAILLDPTLASAHAALARLHAVHWRRAEAQEAYEVAYQLNPKDPLVLHEYGSFKPDVGEYDEAIRLLERLAELDPGASRNQLGLAYRYTGSYEAAGAAVRHNIELSPTNADLHTDLALINILQGNRDDAIGHLQTAQQLVVMGGSSSGARSIAQLAEAYALLDRRQGVERLFNQFQDKAREELIGNVFWARAYVALGDYEQAFQRLEAAINDPVGERQWGTIKANEFSDPILDEPRFVELRNQLGSLD